eukprot:gb/GEZN01013219.1/.p1 GENE.gb/GEZN01013219.1/~~gb/GEZN01013219.1/.p1  ORF type:complete len:230 (+),score=37.48 gb/GEZN01013219.1/:35-691(+)
MSSAIKILNQASKAAGDLLGSGKETADKVGAQASSTATSAATSAIEAATDLMLLASTLTLEELKKAGVEGSTSIIVSCGMVSIGTTISSHPSATTTTSSAKATDAKASKMDALISEASSTSIKLIRGAVAQLINVLVTSAKRMHSKGFEGSVQSGLKLSLLRMGINFSLKSTVANALSASLQGSQQQNLEDQQQSLAEGQQAAAQYDKTQPNQTIYTS